MISGSFSVAYRALIPESERATHNTVVTASGPSMGATPQAIANHLQRGEPAGVLIMVDSALDELGQPGQGCTGQPHRPTVFAGGVATGARQPEAARTLLQFLSRQPQRRLSPKVAWS